MLKSSVFEIYGEEEQWKAKKAVLAGLFCGVWREFEGEKGERAKN